MLKRLLVILILFGISVGLFSSSALAGPPWPAEVIQIREGDFCWFPWLNDNYEGVTLTGTGIWVLQYHNGQLQWNCHTILDFDLPEVASTKDVCMRSELYGLGLCNGNGSFFWSSTNEIIPFGCADEVNGEIYYSNSAHMVVTPNGNVNISCKYDILP